MKAPTTALCLLIILLSSPVAKGEPFSEEDLAATISFDSGHPEEGYLDYARSLARTLSMLNPVQISRVLKGKGPLRKAEVQAAKLIRQQEAAAASLTSQPPGQGKKVEEP